VYFKLFLFKVTVIITGLSEQSSPSVGEPALSAVRLKKRGRQIQNCTEYSLLRISGHKHGPGQWQNWVDPHDLSKKNRHIYTKVTSSKSEYTCFFPS
jgi:hypothetical protein